MPRRPEGPPPPPVVARVRVRFAKRGRLRFLSHRDIARTFERALRRAGIPMAYSAGFSPHPRISWLGAAPTGAASEAEYVELALAEHCDPQALRLALDAALPPGLDVLACAPVTATPLAELVDASRWRLRMPGVGLGDLTAAVAALLARDRVEVERVTKDGHRRFDVRQAVVSMVCRAENDTCAILDVVVRHTTPAVRPDDVLTALCVVAVFRPPVPPESIRLGQGRLLEDGTVADPLMPDRDDAGRLVGRLDA
ncbi:MULTISPECIES: TIGR03936 family radical SAM-associated protein [unclassified Frankia]|uniref:TIGR03936 family radical SAM-associated protein n=1 Tax=unclassified Frankia TaxID=2632575 RepID=UPI002AD444CA|nr:MULTISPECIES: TIGR03936 family radical SAM-associated protein [unclassified Frankia]